MQGAALRGVYLRDSAERQISSVDALTAQITNIGTGLGRVVLAALGGRRQILASVLVGAVVGVPSNLLLAAAFGAEGGA